MAEEKNSCGFRTSIGGQALIEGILMRGPEKQAIVVRDQDGNLVEKVEALKMIKDRYPILGMPLIRGTVNFLAAMVSGVRALMYSRIFIQRRRRPCPPDLSNGWSGISPAKSWRVPLLCWQLRWEWG